MADDGPMSSFLPLEPVKRLLKDVQMTHERTAFISPSDNHHSLV